MPYDKPIKSIIDNIYTYKININKYDTNYILQFDMRALHSINYDDIYTSSTIISKHDLISVLKYVMLNNSINLYDNKMLPYNIFTIDEIFNNNELFYNLDRNDPSMNSIAILNFRKKWIQEHPYFKFQ